MEFVLCPNNIKRINNIKIPSIIIKAGKRFFLKKREDILV